MVRNLLLFLHVALAVALIGPATYNTSTFARHAVAGDAGAAARVHRASRAYGLASQAVALVGIVLALRIDGFGSTWVDTALTLFLVGSILLFAGHLPAQRRAVAAMDGHAAVEPGTITRLRMTAGLYALSWVVIVWLMVAKPG